MFVAEQVGVTVLSDWKYVSVVIKHFMINSSETEMILLIDIKMPTIVGILTFISRINDLLALVIYNH